MAFPSDDEYRADLLDFAGRAIAARVRRVLPSEALLLDIGAGWGKYRWLLPEYEMDAVEAWPPYVLRARLDDYYRRVHLLDAGTMCVGMLDSYDGVIIGDALEHIPARPASRLIADLAAHVPWIWVAVPFEMPQEAIDGNPYEEHQQTDLNMDVMRRRYPALTLIEWHRWGESIKAIYEKGPG